MKKTCILWSLCTLICIVVAENPHLLTKMPKYRKTRDLSDSELFVADYYPQVPLDLPRSRYQFEERRLRPSEEEYFIPDDPYYLEIPPQYNDREIEQKLYDYLDENDVRKAELSQKLNKRVSSSFRERMEREKLKEDEKELAKFLLQKVDAEMVDRELEKLREYYFDEEEPRKMYKSTPIINENALRNLDWSTIGNKKRESDDLDFYLLPSGQSDLIQRPKFNKNYPVEYLYTKHKRFPVAKRSSNFYGHSSKVHHKRGATNNKKSKKIKAESASGTDPKVAKDLSNIFGTKNVKNTTRNFPKDVNGKKENIKKTTIVPVTSMPIKGTTISMFESQNPLNEKQMKQDNKLGHSETLSIKKKSIDWSNYFGIDRRKKKSEPYTEGNEIDNDWLIKRYNNVVAAAVKRSSEYPLNIFRNHESNKENGLAKTEENNNVQQNQLFESKSEEKANEIDEKLKNIENAIIDEALKYTGAHEGEKNPATIQEVKDKVITRLSAAYSLEKLRRALIELKTTSPTQKYNTNNNDNSPIDEKMKKKSDNMEKTCTHKEECGMSEYPTQFVNDIETDDFNPIVSEGEQCLTIENRCQMLANEFSELFYSACKWHQLCYLCNVDENSTEDATGCDMMFLNRADALCQSDVMCQWAARPALKVLRNLQGARPKELEMQCGRNICNLSINNFDSERH